MKHKLFTLLLAMIASVGTMFAETYSGSCGEDLTWSLNTEDSVLTIRGTGAMADYNSSNIPWYEYREAIRSAIIANGVTTIGTNAFYYCRELTSINIPSTVLLIRNYAFFGCQGLTSIEIPNSVTSIGDTSFDICTKLSAIIVAEDNQHYCSQDGVLFTKDATILIHCPEGKQGTYVIPNSVNSIRRLAFKGNEVLTSVEIPNSVTSIGDFAFSACKSLNLIIVAPDNSNYSSEDGVLFNKDKTTLIQYPGGKQGAYTIPNSVTSIEEDAFSGCYGITSVITPNSVINIGNEAFRSCFSLASVIIGNSIVNIGDYAFYGCSSITSVTNYATTPQAINANVFNNVDKSACTLYVPAESVEAYKAADVWKEFTNILPIGESSDSCVIASGTCGAEGDNLTWTLSCDSVLTISGTGAMAEWISSSSSVPWYSNKSTIRSVIIEDGVTSIGSYAFYGCTSLTSVAIPNSVTSIESSAFEDCSGLTSVTIPNSVTSIGGFAFGYCTGLTSVTIPNSVTSIVDYAFSECSGLTSIEIPNSVTYIGSSAFAGCSSLTSINVSNGNANYCSVEGVLFNKDNTVLVQYPGGKNGNYTIPNSVTSIGLSAFYKCSGLTSVTIPNSVTSIGGYAFSECSGLTSIEIPNSVTYIGYYAFQGCSSLTSVTIPSSVTSIGGMAFNNCSSLTSITNKATTPQAINANVFNNVDKSSCTLYVPAESVEAYKTAEVWKEFGNIVAIGDSLEIDYITVAQALEIGSTLAANVSTDKQYTIRGYVSAITTPFSEQYLNQTFYIADDSLSTASSNAEGGFYVYCGKPITGQPIKEGALVELTTAIKNYNNRTIENAEQNVPVTVIQEGTCRIYSGKCGAQGDNITWIFNKCDGLLTISGTGAMEENYNWNGAPWYSNRNFIKSVLIEEEITNIRDNAFSGCIFLTTINVATDNPNYCSVDGVLFNKEKTVLVRCPGGKNGNYTIPNSVTSIGSNAFNNCTSLTSVEISNSVTNIGVGAFHNCSGLTSIEIPNSVTSIGEAAFYECSGLTYIEIPNSVTNIGYAAFNSCSSLISIEIPNSVTSIGDYAFSYCRGLTSITNYATEPQTINANVFNNIDKSACTLYVPAESVEAYKAAEVWKEFGNIVAIEGDTPEPCIIASGTCGAEGDNLTWTLSCDSVLTISGTGAMADYEWNKAPWFSNAANIVSVEISDGITSIGDYAFNHCSKISSVSIPSGVTSIGFGAFNQCFGLTSVNMPNTLISIGESAFVGDTSLTSITIPSSVTYIGNWAFENHASKITSIICEAVNPPVLAAAAYNEPEVFLGIDKSIPLYVPAESIELYRTAAGWKEFGNIVAIGSEPEESNYATIADIYNMAADSAFTLGAFDVVYVPSFQNGSNMYIKDSTGSGVIYMPNYGLQAGDHVEAGLQGKVSIYHGLHEIAPVSTKEELTITSGEAPAPMEATEVPYATNVNQYVIYKGVSFSTDTAFVEGKRHAVNGIWNGHTITFYNQYYMSATLSAGKTYNIIAVNTIYGTIPQAYPLAVEEVSSDTPDSCVIASGACGAEGDNLTWTLTCDSVLTISGTGAMADFEESTNMAPWASLRYAIRSTIIENGVTNIGNFAFRYNNTTSVTIPNSVTQIGHGAFYGCHPLESVAIPNSVTTIEGSAFRYCRALTSVSIPSSVQTIGSDAFEFCDNLETVYIPSSVISIGNSAFAGNKKMRSINVDEANPNYSSIDGVLFNKNQTVLVQYPLGKEGAQYTIPNTVTTLESMSFSYFSKTLSYNGELTSIVIPNSVTMIYGSAFWASTAITSITNYAMVPQVITANDLDKSTCTLYVPAQSIEAYQAADVWKEFGTILPIEGTETPIETVEGNYTIYYTDKDSRDLTDETVTLHVPVAPVIEGFTFVEWRVVEGSLSLGITIQAVYEASEPTSAPEVYTNPANHAQKLIRNGNVYILTDDKVYTITGQKAQ